MRPYISAVKLTREIGGESYLTEIPAIRYLMREKQLELEAFREPGGNLVQFKIQGTYARNPSKKS